MSHWKQGDTLPDMVIDCFDDNSRRPDLTQASEVMVICRNARGEDKFSRVVSGNANGVVTVPLLPSDTDTPGNFNVRVRVTWPSGKRQHYPPGDRAMTMTVTR